MVGFRETIGARSTMRRRNERITRLVEYHAGKYDDITTTTTNRYTRSIRDNRYWRSDVSSSIPLPRSDSSNPITPVFFDLCRSKKRCTCGTARNSSVFRDTILPPLFFCFCFFFRFVHASKSNNGTIVIADNKRRMAAAPISSVYRELPLLTPLLSSLLSL